MDDWLLDRRNQLIVQGRREARALWAMMVYRWLLGTVFLLVAFQEFPDHRASIALSVLFVGVSLQLVSAQLGARAILDELRLDLGERKTRHTVTVAQSWTVAQQAYEPNEFWREVEDAVRAEMDDEPKSTPWAGFGLTMLSLFWRIAFDVIGVGIIYALSGTSST
jgi:hypothetical protein